jgi:hypothetical protein
MIWVKLIVRLVVIVLGLPVVLLNAQSSAASLQDLLRNRIESAGVLPKLSVGKG